MSPDQIFKIRYDEMALSLQRQQSEDMLKIAQSLRQILVDGDPLLHVVNKERQLKVKFTVGMSVQDISEEMAGLGLPIPDTHILGEFRTYRPHKDIKIDNLLSFKVVKHDGDYYSVKDVIKTCCNRLGAVHYGNPENDEEVEAGIRKLGVLLSSLGMQGAFSVLVLIGNVVVEGLNELRQQMD